MPLMTEIRRNGEKMKMPNGWGGFHVAAMVVAMMFEAPESWGDAQPNDDLDYPNEPQGIGPGDVFSLMAYPVIGQAIENACEANGQDSSSRYVLQKEHRFIDTQDGEILHLLPGDELSAWRSH